MYKILLLTFVFIGTLYSSTNISTGEKQNTMIELFTSEGCSSCPPAERWINKFKDNPLLWNKFVPIVYHVDYWDYIGWRDKFAKPQHSIKQRNYAKKKYTSGVYTPGFLINSKEWRDWFGLKYISDTNKNVGVLSLNINNDDIEIKFNQGNSKYNVNIALLGFGFKSLIKRGENKGEVLEHDFVVLEQKTYSFKNSILKTKLLKSKTKAKKYAIAIWLTKENSMEIIQSTGTWL